ncbi:hypothetical protein B296_00017797 [Ensete ventricosum]|uniref:Uncharacterized protein n=1 Tax=Ensete ventricosum TaxID=4639 RepID=A0A426Z798_ENSVE|nr:hypothetical protein B296_00017797 [Ensete ventricosum]
MSAIGRSYLRSLLPLWLTMSSYFSTPYVILAIRRVLCPLQLWRVGLTHVRSGRARGKFLGSIFGAPIACQHEVPEDLEYNIPIEYGFHVPRPGQRPYSSDNPGVCISVDALEVNLQFPLHPTIEECIRWSRISPSQVAHNSWCYLVFLGECREAGIIPTRNLFMACFRLCKTRGDYYLTARIGFRILSRRHKSRHDEGGSWSQSKGKEPAVPIEDPEGQAESPNEAEMPVFVHLKSMKDFYRMKVRKNDVGYYALYMSDLAQ